MLNPWMILVAAGMLEVGWAVGLKFTDGFSFARRPLPSALTLLAMIGSMYLLALAIRSIPIGTGYAIWTGIGAVGAATLGMVLFHEPVTASRVACLLLVVSGIVGLKLTATPAAHAPTSAAHAPTSAAHAAMPAAFMPLYIGTYTNGASKGIYRVLLDASAGTLGEPTLVAEMTNPSFLAMHPTLPVLYAVSEVGDVGPEKSGAIVAFGIAPDGSLHELGRRASHGAGPCFVSVDHGGRTLLVANYGGASVASFALDASGMPGEAASVAVHAGRGPDTKRQTRAYAHSIIEDPSGRYALAADLGTDSVIEYALDAIAGAITRVGEVRLAPGSGPRHMAFAPDGRTLYVINELASTLTRLTWDATAGTLAAQQTIGTLPEAFAGENATAEVAVHPNGRFVYASNRGHDSIAVFCVNADGSLTAVGHVGSVGASPRHFAVDPSGTFLIAANQNSDMLQVFRLDGTTGAPVKVDGSARVATPVCVRFAR